MAGGPSSHDRDDCVRGADRRADLGLASIHTGIWLFRGDHRVHPVPRGRGRALVPAGPVARFPRPTDRRGRRRVGLAPVVAVARSARDAVTQPRRVGDPGQNRAGVLLAGAVIGVVLAAISAGPAIDRLGLTPLQVANLITGGGEGRTGIAGVIGGSLDKIGVVRWLRAANQLDRPTGVPLPTWAGASTAHDGVLPIPPGGRLRSVATVDALRQAIDTAQPGDVILLQPGVYPIRGKYIQANRPGTEAAPITVRSPQSGGRDAGIRSARGAENRRPHTGGSRIWCCAGFAPMTSPATTASISRRGRGHDPAQPAHRGLQRADQNQWRGRTFPRWRPHRAHHADRYACAEDRVAGDADRSGGRRMAG